MSVIVETSIGDFTLDLYTDERPRSCQNFLKLCKIKYYNFSLFHSVQSNLVAQTGDPTATGRGGESVFARLYGEQARFFDMEVSPRIKHTKKGLVSMVNNGSGMHGSQFFITLAENLDYLDGKHTVFGEVAEGMEIIDKLNNTFCGEDNRPHQDIRIYHTILLDDPYDDPDGLVVPSSSPGPTQEMLNSDHIPCDADIDEDKDKTEEELAEMLAEKEAKANTQILEMVGDLPDADVAPPENVLFVCKLNPVTTSDDLEIIFSRFGNIVSCDVIKDSKTGESLQYAFIEFDNPKSCENAYFKMDNVLIDDRRIHVDFSQSVSKLKWKGKGRGVEVMASGDAPVYVLKNQQRRDNDYDLVYEEDVPAADANGKIIKHRQSNKQRGLNPRHNQQDRRDKAPTRGTMGDDSRRGHDNKEDLRDSSQDRWKKDERKSERGRSPLRDRGKIGRDGSPRREGGKNWRDRSPLIEGRKHGRDRSPLRDNGKYGRERSPLRDSGKQRRGRSPLREDQRKRDFGRGRESRRDSSSQERSKSRRDRNFEDSRGKRQRNTSHEEERRREKQDRQERERRGHSPEVSRGNRERNKGSKSDVIVRSRSRSSSQGHVGKNRKQVRKQARDSSVEASDSSSKEEKRVKKKKKKKYEETSDSDSEAKKHKSKKSKKHKKKDLSDSGDEAPQKTKKKRKKSKRHDSQSASD